MARDQIDEPRNATDDPSLDIIATGKVADIALAFTHFCTLFAL